MATTSALVLALVLLGGSFATYAWAWRQIARYAQLRGMRRWASHVAGFILGVIPATMFVFAVPMVSGAVPFWDATIFLGLVATAFAGLHWLPKRALDLSRSSPVSARQSVLQGLLTSIKEHNDSVAQVKRNRLPAPALAPCQPQTSAIQESAPGLSLPELFEFEYSDGDGVITQRRVRVHGVAHAGGRQYFEGLCMKRQAIRTFRVDRILGPLKRTSDGQYVTAGALLQIRGAPKATGIGAFIQLPKRSSPWQTAVFFAGVGSSKRIELEDLAESAGWQVRMTITKTVDYVVEGTMAGSSQLAKAAELGIRVIDEDDFRALLQTIMEGCGGG